MLLYIISLVMWIFYAIKNTLYFKHLHRMRIYFAIKALYFLLEHE